MEAKFFIAFILFFFHLKISKGDPGRDLCKIVNHSGLKCSKISSYFFPFDTLLSYNDDLAHFTNELKYLEIGSSNISVLQSRSFQRTPYLSHLVLSKVFLIEIETGAFEGLRRLKLVDLSYNLLQSIPIDVFKYTKLNRLDLEGNALIEFLPDGPILNARFLTSFSLKNCNLQHLSDSAFQETPSLVHLDLSQNYLKMLPENLFSSLNNLAFVDLSDNRFQSLNMKVFESVPKFPKFPSAVILANNPWVCDCKLSKLGDWVAKNTKTGVWSEKPVQSRLKRMVECQTPKRMSWNSEEFQQLISSC